MEKYTPGNDYAADWKKVLELENKGLTEDARKLVQTIYSKAKSENNAAQTVKTLMYLYKYDTFIVENSEQKIVDQLKQEIEQGKYPLKPVLQSVLADLYWQYFQQNRYSILNRTEVTNQDLPDFKTWDANRFTTEITNLYLASIADAEKLKTTPVELEGASVRFYYICWNRTTDTTSWLLVSVSGVVWQETNTKRMAKRNRQRCMPITSLDDETVGTQAV